MRKFTFNLEAVRSLREQAETQRKEELAHELLRHAQTQAELRRAHESLADARDQGTRLVARPLSGADLTLQQAFVERLEREAVQAHHGVAVQEQVVERRREALVGASRDRQVLDRLRERRLREHEEEALRREEGVLGEIALAVHRRITAGGGLG
ncbi:MAG: flagellar export protein FliJ [Thermoleophilia bacterium]